MAAIDISGPLGTATTDIVSTVSDAAPIGLTVLAVTVGVPLAVRLFKRVAH